MSNVPVKQPTPVVLVNCDLPWRSVFRLTFRFAIASLFVWIAIAIPFAVVFRVIDAISGR